MNILVLTSQFYLPSGAESLQVEFALELVGRPGISVTLMALGDRNDPRVSIEISKLEARNLRVEMLNLMLHPNPLAVWSAARWLRKWILSEQISFVETSLYTPSVLAALATSGLDVTLIHGVHAPYYRDMKIGRWNLKKYFWQLTLKRKNIFFYSISDHVGYCWQSFFGVSSNRVRRIYNSIADSHFSEPNCRVSLCKELKIDPLQKLILYVGRIRPDKGIEVLIKAVDSKLLKSQAHLIIIGLVEPEFTELGNDIIALSKQSGSRIHYLGYRRNVASWFASSDLFVLPTQREGFGMVIMEALAAGCPVISSTVDALPEIYKDSGAILVDPDDITGLWDAIDRQLALTTDQRRSLSFHERRFASNFTTSRRTKELLNYMEHCRSIISGKT